MHTFILLLSCLGFFMLYNTSKKAKLSAAGRWEKWVQAHPERARPAGLFLLMVSMILWVLVEGLGVGLFAGGLLLMVSASYWVAIAPLYYLKWKHILIFSTLGILIELFIF